MTWCNCLKKIESITILLHETKLFIDGLNHVVKHFSSILFWITSAVMVNIILLSFLSISQLIDADGSMEWQRLGFFLSCAIVAPGFLYFIFQLCHLSELLAVNVGELEDLLIDYHFKNNRESPQKNEVCNLLSKFKGFEANGYFTLNHSMLTGMIGNIVTYLVILVQFRQSGA